MVGFTWVAEDEFVEVCTSVLGMLANTGYDRFDEREDDVDRLRPCGPERDSTQIQGE